MGEENQSTMSTVPSVARVINEGTEKISEADPAGELSQPAESVVRSFDPAEQLQEVEWQVQRDEAKLDGDACFKAADYGGAISHYSRALSLDPDHAVLLSNRSAAFLKNNEKSKALHDAQACVKIGTMGIKGVSRLAAALQALGRFPASLEEYDKILLQEPQHSIALRGAQDCRTAIAKMHDEELAKRKAEIAEDEFADGDAYAEDGDDLDDFFNDVDEAAATVQHEKIRAAEPVATNAIKNQKKDLGTAMQQIERLLQPNFKWRNLNPFYVLDVSHTASRDEINRRYKALSLLLHPDKNPSISNAQDAYDEVLKAKDLLEDENKYNHVKALIEEGQKLGTADYNSRKAKNALFTGETLESSQVKAVFRLFAEIEQARRDVNLRERKQEQRERQQEEDELVKERNSRTFDKEWKETNRVEKRIGNWRDFRKKKQQKDG